MSRHLNLDHAPGWRRPALTVVAAIVGFSLAALTAVAVAKTFALKVVKNVHVTNTPTKEFRVRAVDVHEAVAVGAAGFAVYTFQGETTHHLICKKTSNPTTNCWSFWPPVSVKSAKGLSAQSGIKGKLGTFHNHGTLQLTLGGMPLYYFTPDIKSGNKHLATGDELKTFGSIWHIVKASSSGKAQSQPTTTTTGTGTTSTNPYGMGY